MKKILFVANVAKEHINKFHIPTIRYFKTKGWRVDVACSADEEVPECDCQYHMCWKRSPFTVRTIIGIIQLKNLIERERYDIVYCHTPVGGLVARLATRKLRKQGTKVAYCAHGLHFFEGAPLINWLIYYPIEKMLARYTDIFFTINPEDCKLVLNKFNKKMLVKCIDGIGVDFNRLKISDAQAARQEYRNTLQIPNDALVLIYVAELIKNKNQTMLIDALQVIRQRRENTFLLLVGPDHENGRFQKYVKKRGIENNVIFFGWRNDIAELMNMADICVASSIREGFGINLVEAMYCGLPVVATKNRGHLAIISNGENGFVVEINDITNMADRVLDVYENESLKKKFSQADISRYDCENVAEIVYNELTERV